MEYTRNGGITVAEDNSNNAGAEGQTETEVKTFTQEEVDTLIKNRLAQERKAREKEDAERKRKSEIEKMDGEQKLRAEHEQALKELNESLNAARRESAELKVGKQLATLGYDAEFAPLLTGADDTESRTNVERFDKMISRLVDDRVKKSLASGAPGIPGGTDTKEKDDLARLYKAAGLRPR